jgi:flavorubredoxin
VHSSPYLVVGDRASVLFDTGVPVNWATVSQRLDAVLGERPLDWIVPSHYEVPHAGSLERLLRKYPRMLVGGDVRDYHLFYPHAADRLRMLSEIDLGGGNRLEILPAVIKDLVSTVWAYETKNRVLFCADGFAYSHLATSNNGDETLAFHYEGDCARMSSELPKPPGFEQAFFITKSGLFWSRYARSEPFFRAFDELRKRYDVELICPAHGNVIDDLDLVMPSVVAAHETAYQQAH